MTSPGSGRGPRPPRVVRWLLRLWVDPADLDYLWTDLEEGYARRVEADGRMAGVRWLAWQVRSSFEPWSSLRTERAEGPITRPSTSPGGKPPMFDRLVRDTSYAFRALSRRPLFTGVAILTLTIGIGANTAIFSLVNGVLFKGVDGLADTNGLVEISRDVDGDFFDMAYPILDHFRENSSELADIAALTPGAVALGVETDADVVMSFSVTENYFDVLRLQPYAGRFFSEDEARFPRVRSVAVVSHRFATRRFDSPEDAVGAVIRVNSHPAEIVGVAGVGFGSHAVGLKSDIWLPLGMPVPGLRGTDQLSHPESGIVEAIGRLAPGSSAERARAELSSLANTFLEDFRGSSLERPYQARVEPWAPIPAIIRVGVNAFLAVLMVLVGLVLAMACLNVSGMLLSRISERSPELAVRQVLGAGRRRLVRQLLTESMILYMAGALGGVLLAVWATRLLQAFQPPVPIPGFDIQLDLGIDWRVLGFAVIAAFVTGVLFSLAPALRGVDRDPGPALRGGGRGHLGGRTRMRSTLVAAQMGTTVLLLVGAGLFVRALGSLQAVDTGWETDGVMVMDFDLELSGYTAAEGPDFYRLLRERVTALPGIDAAGFASKLPLAGRSSFGDINVPGIETPPDSYGFPAYNNTVSQGYFETVGLELREGRDFTEEDTNAGRRVTVVNETMARRFWGEESPVGQFFTIGRDEYWVVGVVEDAKYNRLAEEPLNFYYLSADQRQHPQLVLYARGEMEDAGLITALREAATQIDRDLPLLAARPLDEALEVFFLPQRIAAWVAGALGMVALILGAVGVYGITAFTVGRRTREIGIRLALGASRRSVMRRMMTAALRAPALGMAIGTVGALILTRFLSGFLAGVNPVDPVTFGAVLSGLAAITIGAVLVPTRRATAIDPAETLRAE